MSTLSNNIKITVRGYPIDNKTFYLPYNAEEPIWKFSKRVGEEIPSGVSFSDEGNTMTYRLLYKLDNGSHVTINTFSDRLKKIGSFVSDPSKGLIAVSWFFTIFQSFTYRGNASPHGPSERSICAICLNEMKQFTSGKVSNPLIAHALKCSHAFHQGCLKPFITPKMTNNQMPACPMCRKGIEPRLATLIFNQSIDPFPDDEEKKI